MILMRVCHIFRWDEHLLNQRLARSKSASPQKKKFFFRTPYSEQVKNAHLPSGFRFEGPHPISDHFHALFNFARKKTHIEEILEKCVPLWHLALANVNSSSSQFRNEKPATFNDCTNNFLMKGFALPHVKTRPLNVNKSR